ncbi:MAG: hypothetical protein RJA70_2575 [Pseudomonadota bacterium]|jgi:hypothetical protein
MVRSLAMLIALGLGACGGDRRPPLASDFETGKDEPPSDTSGPAGASTYPDLIVEDDEPTGGGCGETTVELEIQRPNFYFVLDSSESMLEPMPGTGGVTRHLAARLAVTEMLRAVGHRVNYGAAIFPKAEGCEPGAEVFPLREGDARSTDGDDGPVLDGLTFTLRKFAPSGATPVAQTLTNLRPELAAMAGVTSVFLLTDGAPNCDLSEPCSNDECIPNIESFELSDGRQCDERLNCCDPDFAPHLCLDGDGAEAALAELAKLGIRTYVIGIPGSEIYADVLSQMAVAAGTARKGVVGYYQVEDAEALALTLSELGEELSLSCEFDIGAVPRWPDRVSVVLDGELLAKNESDGWGWKSDTTVELVGDACREWKLGNVAKVEIFQGCHFTVN